MTGVPWGKDMILSSCIMYIWAWSSIKICITKAHDPQAGRKSPLHLYIRIPMSGNYMFSYIANPPPISRKETTLTPPYRA